MDKDILEICEEIKLLGEIKIEILEPLTDQVDSNSYHSILLLDLKPPMPQELPQL